MEKVDYINTKREDLPKWLLQLWRINPELAEKAEIDYISLKKQLSIHSVVNSNCDKKPKKCKHKYGLFTYINNGQNLMFKCKKCKRDMTYEQLQIERKERK